MKKIFSFLLCAATILTACEKSNQSTSEQTEGSEVTFTSEIHTRVTDNLFDESDVISVSAFENSEMYAQSVAYTYSNGLFSSSDAINYTDGDQRLQFLATYPVVDDLTKLFDFTVESDQSVEGNYEKSDLLISLSGLTTERCPELSFYHKLSSVLVTVTNSTGETNASAIVNAQRSIVCDLGAMTYTGTGDIESIKAASYDDKGFKVMVAPQTVAAGSTFATMESNGKTYKWVCATDMVLNPGTQYTYTWNLSDNTIKFTGVINGWGDGGNGGDIGTGEEGDGGDVTPPVTGDDKTISFDGSELPTTYEDNATVTIDEYSFVANMVANFSTQYETQGPIQFKKAESYIYNSTALEGLSQVVITLAPAGTQYNNFEIYAGSTSNPSGSAIAPSKSGDVCTYEVPAGSSYIAIKNPSNYTAYAFSIDFVIGEGGSTGGEGGGDVTPPTQDNGAKYAGWAELPTELVKSGDYYYAYHMRADESSVRNFSVCYSKDMMCPVWVAAPMHTSYLGSVKRTDSYKDDPEIPFTENGRWDGYTRGHMLGSSDRTITTSTNRQVFYHSNIAPQLGYVNGGGFNTGGGVWNNLEAFTDGQICADTLYQVIGSYWKDTRTKVDGTVIPTHYYKALLRTKSGHSGKAVWNCSTDELKCVVFMVEHNTKQHKVQPHEGMMMSVSEAEKLTGLTFFANVPNAPKDTYTASDWGI